VGFAQESGGILRTTPARSNRISHPMGFHPDNFFRCANALQLAANDTPTRSQSISASDKMCVEKSTVFAFAFQFQNDVAHFAPTDRNPGPTSAHPAPRPWDRAESTAPSRRAAACLWNIFSIEFFVRYRGHLFQHAVYPFASVGAFQIMKARKIVQHFRGR